MNLLKSAAFPKRAMALLLAAFFANTLAPAHAQYSSLIGIGTRVLRHAARHSRSTYSDSNQTSPDPSQSAPASMTVDPDTGEISAGSGVQIGPGVHMGNNVFINGQPATGSSYSGGSSTGSSYPGTSPNLQNGVYQPNPYVPTATEPVSYTPSSFTPAMPTGYDNPGSRPPTVYRGRHADRHSVRRIQQEVITQNKAIDLYNEGVDQLKCDKFKEAIASCNAALQINPSMGEARHLLGIAYNDTQEYQSALDQCQQAIQLDSHSADNYYTAADAARHLHDYKLAYKYCQRFLALGGSGDRADEAKNIIAILDNNYFHQADGNYLSDATKEGKQRWLATAMPLKVYLAQDSSVNGYRPAFATALKEAFKDWESSSSGAVSFVFVDKAEEANIKCAWTAEKTKLGSLEELGLTKRMAMEDGQIISANIDLYSLFDKKGTEDQLVAMAKAVDLHEIGHALGLDHSPRVYDIMYYCSMPDGMELPLSERDKRTMIALYADNTWNVATTHDDNAKNMATTVDNSASNIATTPDNNANNVASAPDDSSTNSVKSFSLQAQQDP